MTSCGRPATVVLFDLGGVLVRVRGYERLEELVREAGDDSIGGRHALQARWLSSPAVRSFELGQIPPGVFAQRLVDEWQLQIEPSAFAEDVATWIVGPFPGALRLIADLQGRGYHVSCLSNCNALHWEAMAPFVSLLDSSFSSHLLGQIKPDEQVFRSTLERLGAAPEEVVFLDDSPPNIETAKRLGIRSFQVEGAEACRAALVAEGLL